MIENDLLMQKNKSEINKCFSGTLGCSLYINLAQLRLTGNH